MDAYMGATAFRQVRQDRLRQQTGFPIAGLASLVVTDANRKSLASALEAPGSDAALAQEGAALPPQCALAPDEITQLIEAGHLPPQRRLRVEGATVLAPRRPLLPRLRPSAQ